jgi:catechol 2,3-dioxygenase-like lactoylglutathione lyase family enzyme
MKLNHLDLHVPDVRALTSFLVEHFDLELRSNPDSPALAILSDEEGFTLVVQRAKDDARYPEGFHIGFLVDDESIVRARHASMVAAGVTKITPIDMNNRGTMFYCQAPGDIVVECSCPKRRDKT